MILYDIVTLHAKESQLKSENIRNNTSSTYKCTYMYKLDVSGPKVKVVSIVIQGCQ